MSETLGALVVVEGPNGVGKTTVCASLTGLLAGADHAVYSTAEPSRSPLGLAVRGLQVTMPPRALALACAADRLDHVVREIEPAMQDGKIVICDRYLPSSLVLQRFDSFDPDWIWDLNAGVIPPTLTVYLDHDSTTIDRRLDERGRQSRFEQQKTSALELQYYRDAREFLAKKGWRQTVVDCRTRTAGEIAQIIKTSLEQSLWLHGDNTKHRRGST